MLTSSLKPSRLARYRDIARVLVRHGARSFVDTVGLSELLGHESRDGSLVRAEAESLVEDLEALGPTFVKFGQILSSRADLLPPEYLAALARLQDHVEPVPVADVYLALERELGPRWEQMLVAFDPVPLAAASLGQVHRANLANGRPVVVKVQRPNLNRIVQEDLGALGDLAELAERHTERGQQYRVVDLIRQFRRSLLQELDYTREALNLRTMRENLAEFENIIIPEPIAELTTPRVLVMDFISGIKVTAIESDRLAAIGGEALATELMRAYLKQVLEDGFFHADPHPGNILLTDDNRIAMLDLGMTSRVTPVLQDHLLALLMSISEGRSEDAAQTAIKIGYAGKFFEYGRFREQISELVTQTQGMHLRDLDMGRMMLEIGRMAGDTGLRVPPQMTMIGKMLMHLDQVGKALAPGFDPNAMIRENIAELVHRRMLRSLSPSALLAQSMELKQFVTKLPGRVEQIIDALASNDLKLRIDAVDEDRLIHGLQKIANRISAGLVLASLIVAGAVLMHIETAFTVGGYPAIAAVLFTVAALMGFWLVITILWSDHHRK